MALENLIDAGFISSQWEGTLIAKGIARLAPFSLHSSIALSTPSLVPDITI